MNEIIIEIFKVQSDFALEVWFSILVLALKVPITTIVVCFSRLLKCLKKLMTNSVNPYQTVSLRAV